MLNGSAWNLQDYFLDLSGKMRKRGGWAYASDDIHATTSTASYVATVVYAPFVGNGNQLLALDEDGELYRINTSSGAVTDVGAMGTRWQPVLHTNKLIFPASTGANAPNTFDGSSIVGLAGSPPSGKFAAVYKDRTVLANSNANVTRAWFSGPADPTVWNTSVAYWSFSQPITGMAALPGALLVFMEKQTGRLRGSTPPPGTDFIADDPLFTQGCTDARSIVVTGPYAIFCNPLGIWRTNGTNIPEDLTAAVGLKRYWQQTVMSSYSSSSWTIVGGMIGTRYIVSVMNGSSFVDCLWVEGASGSGSLRAGRLGNMTAAAFASAVTGSEELYMGLRDEARVAKLSTTLTPGVSYKNDGDGTAVTPLAETPYYPLGRPGKKWVRGLFVTYDMRDAASDDPALTVSYTLTPDGSYTALGTTLAETADQARSRLWMSSTAGGGVAGQGVALKLAQSNASSETKIVSLEAEADPAEPSDL